MTSKIIILWILLIILIPTISTNKIVRHKRSAPSHGSSDNKTGNGLYNPFDFMHIESHKMYLLGAAFIILFVFIKLGLIYSDILHLINDASGSEKEFNYCCLACYKNCRFTNNFKLTKRSVCRTVCLTHRTSPGNIFPESAFLIIGGVLPAVVMLLLGVTLDGTLSAKIFFNIILVPIIMAAGWATDKLTFYRNVGTILWFAIFGTVLNAAILMPFLYYGSVSRWKIYSRLDMDLVDAGLYSILICAVDPVAVLSVFESMHIDKLVYNVVFGESLLNDGVAVVFYNAFDEMKLIHNLRFFESVGLVFLFFLYAFSISVVLACIMAIIISFISKLFFHHQPMQLVVVLSLNYLTYVIGDTIKGSGILSLFFCVIIQKQYVQANLTYTTNRVITQVLTQLALLSEGIVFILMGLTAFSPTGISSNTDVPFAFYLIFLCYVSRYIVIYTLGFIANIFRNEKLDYRKGLFIQAHGGLRGAIGFALSLTIGEHYKYRYIFQTSTFIMVFFSVFILGSTIKPLVNLCKIPLESHLDKTIIISLQEKVVDRTKEGIKAIIGSTSLRFRWERGYRKINNRYFKKWFMSTKAIERNVSHSSVVKLHRDQSILEAQQIADEFGSVMIRDIFKSEGDVRLRMYRKAWSSYASFHSLTDITTKGSGDMHHNISIPDISMIDKTITRRDVDDQMTHHNMLEGMGRNFYKSEFSTKRVKKHRRRNEYDIDNHRSRCYKVPHRVINIKSKRKNRNPEEILAKMQKRFDPTPKMNKSVKFNYDEDEDSKPIFKLGQQETPISKLVDKSPSLFEMVNDKDFNKPNQTYTNVAYENDEQFDFTEMRPKTRNMSIFDPFMGCGIPEIGILSQKPPWFNDVNHVANKSNDQSAIAINNLSKQNSKDVVGQSVHKF